MEKQEAADFLGVSVRTVERLAAQGRLTKGRARRKTRPVVVFDRTQLETLKEDLQSANRRIAVTPNGDRPKEAIGFRLDPYYIDRLSTVGENHGLSPAEFARKLVIEGLEDTKLDDVREEISRLREGLGHMFYAILVKQFGMSADAADTLVQQTGLAR